MADRYRNVAHLATHEREGVDFRVRCRRLPSRVAIIAPHGGKIEPSTSVVATAIAEEDFNLYCFDGMKPDNNWETLHITSGNFDEPRCLDLIAQCDCVVAVHGLAAAGRFVKIAGRDDPLRRSMCERLRLADFAIREAGRYAGAHPQNICNRGRSGCGVQLEISRDLRDALTGALLTLFANAVRDAIVAAVQSEPRSVGRPRL